MQSTRSHLRHRRRIRVTIGSAAVFTSDIGSGGFSAELMRVPAGGSAVEGSIRLNGVEVRYVGVVVWVRPGDARLNIRGRVGVRFTQLPPDMRLIIESPAFSRVA